MACPLILGVHTRWSVGNRVHYELSPAGKELEPIVEALGSWGIRWVPEIGDEDLDPHLLLWDIHRNIAVDSLPEGRTVLQFDFTDVPVASRQWWIVITDEGVDVCDADPGFDVRVAIETGLRTLTLVWRGDLTWTGALRSGTLELHGETRARRALPSWLKLSPLAPTPRPEATAV